MTSHHGQAESPASSYRQAFDHIRAEYLEMRGMCLTPQQVQGLTGVDVEVCTTVLEDLVRAKFLQLCADRTYLRARPMDRPECPLIAPCCDHTGSRWVQSGFA